MHFQYTSKKFTFWQNSIVLLVLQLLLNNIEAINQFVVPVTKACCHQSKNIWKSIKMNLVWEKLSSPATVMHSV